MSSSWWLSECSSLLCSTAIPIRSSQSIDHSMERTNSSMKRMNRMKRAAPVNSRRSAVTVTVHFGTHTHSGLRFDSPLCISSVLFCGGFVSFHTGKDMAVGPPEPLDLGSVDELPHLQPTPTLPTALHNLHNIIKSK